MHPATSGSHLPGTAKMRSTSTWRTIIDGTEPVIERSAANASRRDASRGRPAGAGQEQGRDRKLARHLAPDAVRHLEGKAANYAGDGATVRQAAWKRSGYLDRSAAQI